MVNGRRYWIKSPGFDSAPSYCPNLNCEWGFKASRNDLIEVTSHSVGLRMSDTLTIFDYNHSVIASLSAVSSSNSPKLISTVSSGSVLFQFQSIPLNMQVLSANPINGFELAVESKRIVYNRKEEIVLEENLRSFTVNISAGYSFMLHVKSTRNRTIHLYTFGSLYNTGILIDVFDGATIDAMLLDTSALYNSSNAVDSTNELQSSGSDLMFRLIGTDQINNLLTSSFNYFTFFGIVSDIVDVTYAEQCSQPLVQAFTSEAILVFERQTPTTSHATPEITTPNIPTPEITTPNIPTPEIPTTKPTPEIPTTKPTPEIPTTKPTLPTATPEIPTTKPVTKLPKTTRKTTARLCTTALHHIPLQQQRQIRSGLALRVASDNPNVQLYKGITNRPQNLLTNSYPYPSFVFGDDLTFVYMSTNAPNRIRVRSTTMLRDYTLAPLSTTSHGYLYSPDYLADDDLGRIYQRYELSMESSSALGIKLEVANRINNCQVQLFGDSDGKSTLNEKYPKSLFTYHSDLNCSVVQSRGAVAQLHDVLFMIFSIFFMFASRTILLP
ncbi:unnamed protein product [Anisakis simplex]|uniref:Protein kinase domain-containing protein n=1 Tax=Anisakis simplex TaxID=6269 RepID=A0A0M3IY91_ANISI|nr:unnamed protein product [Anisakis simplex]